MSASTGKQAEAEALIELGVCSAQALHTAIIKSFADILLCLPS